MSRSTTLLAALAAAWMWAPGAVPGDPAGDAGGPPFEVAPAAPAAGASVGSRPLFRVRYRPVEFAPREVQVRLVLQGPSRPGAGAGSVRHYEKRRRDGSWLAGEAGELLFRPRRPLDDGRYEWRLERWDGVRWRPAGDGPLPFRVDTVAPASVERLRVAPDPAGGGLRLDWQPVALDIQGGPEWVARYRIYRFERSPPLRAAAVHEIGTSRQPWFVDRDLPAGTVDRVFYRVVAEDEAGNVMNRPELPLRPPPDPARR